MRDFQRTMGGRSCGISDSNCVITVHAQLFLASGLCVYKCVCIVIHFGSVQFVRSVLSAYDSSVVALPVSCCVLGRGTSSR